MNSRVRDFYVEQRKANRQAANKKVATRQNFSAKKVVRKSFSEGNEIDVSKWVDPEKKAAVSFIIGSSEEAIPFKLMLKSLIQAPENLIKEFMNKSDKNKELLKEFERSYDEAAKAGEGKTARINWFQKGAAVALTRQGNKASESTKVAQESSSQNFSRKVVRTVHTKRNYSFGTAVQGAMPGIKSINNADVAFLETIADYCDRLKETHGLDSVAFKEAIAYVKQTIKGTFQACKGAINNFSRYGRRNYSVGDVVRAMIPGTKRANNATVDLVSAISRYCDGVINSHSFKNAKELNRMIDCSCEAVLGVVDSYVDAAKQIGKEINKSELQCAMDSMKAAADAVKANVKSSAVAVQAGVKTAAEHVSNVAQNIIH